MSFFATKDFENINNPIIYNEDRYWIEEICTTANITAITTICRQYKETKHKTYIFNDTDPDVRKYHMEEYKFTIGDFFINFHTGQWNVITQTRLQKNKKGFWEIGYILRDANQEPYIYTEEALQKAIDDMDLKYAFTSEEHASDMSWIDDMYIKHYYKEEEK